MFAQALRVLTSGRKPVVLVVGLLLLSLFLLSAATHNSGDFSRLYSLLVAINVVALVLLVALIARHFLSLAKQYREGTPGARLTGRMVVMFILLSFAPVSIVYYFSVEFLQRGIDSWFDVKVERALKDALELGKGALDSRLREQLHLTRQLAERLAPIPDSEVAVRLTQMRQEVGANELSLFTVRGRTIASSIHEDSARGSTPVTQAIRAQLEQGLDYAAIEPIASEAYRIRVALLLPAVDERHERRMVQAIFDVPERVSDLADSVQAAYSQYRELAYLRGPLKFTFTLTLSLVLMLSLLAAVWAAFFSARRLVAPIGDLVEGTKAVAAGDYDKRLPLPGNDEIGFLVRSFNEMTRRISAARDHARRSQREVEAQRAYLEIVLARLSSGVMTFDHDGTLRTSNSAADQILKVRLSEGEPLALDALLVANPALEPLISAVRPHLQEKSAEWRAEVVLQHSAGRQILICRGSALPDVGEVRGGHVIVFDDVTALLQAQRDAAWGEVARRLAHEIKNPLTPIQLSAERLRHKYLKKMSPEDAEVLERSTHTIVQQVETMKEMVKAFSDYARTPRVSMVPIDLNRVVREVLDLFHTDDRLVEIHASLEADLPQVEADVGRIRQLLLNLVKNSMEAGERQRPLRIRVSTRVVRDGDDFVELRVEDSGPGIAEALLDRVFEPYVTSKPKGTGLGLAIVKKIVEEHNGALRAENLAEGGAAVTVRLPLSGRAVA